MTAYMEPMKGGQQHSPPCCPHTANPSGQKKFRAVDKQINHEQDIDINCMQRFHLPAGLPTQLPPLSGIPRIVGLCLVYLKPITMSV